MTTPRLQTESDNWTSHPATPIVAAPACIQYVSHKKWCTNYNYLIKFKLLYVVFVNWIFEQDSLVRDLDGRGRLVVVTARLDAAWEWRRTNLTKIEWKTNWFQWFYGLRKELITKSLWQLVFIIIVIIIYYEIVHFFYAKLGLDV